MPYDVFISFSADDNDPLKPGTNGWVTDFHYVFKRLLKKFVGVKDLKIYPRFEFVGNGRGEGGAEIDSPQNEVVILVLSPFYLNDDSCLEDLKRLDSKIKNGELAKDRWFKIAVTPFDADKLKAAAPQVAMQNSVIEFFELKSENDGRKFFEFNLSSGGDHEKKFYDAVTDLAYQVASALKNQVEPPVAETGKSESVFEKPKVYLANAKDSTEAFRKVKLELVKYQYDVLPKIELLKSSDFEAFKRQVSGEMIPSFLALLLLGQEYEEELVVNGAKKSYFHLQAEVAAELALKASRNPSSYFKPLFWLPENIAVADIDSNLQEILPGELPSGPPKDLINKVFGFLRAEEERLRGELARARRAAERGNPTNQIYLLFDEPDRDAAKKLESKIADDGFTLLSARDYFNKTDKTNLHKQFLEDCSAVITYWNAASLDWVEPQLKDLDKAKVNLRQHRPFSADVVYLDGGNIHEKQEQLREFGLLNSTLNPARKIIGGDDLTSLRFGLQA